MICHIFKRKKKRKNGDAVESATWYGRYRLCKDDKIVTVNLEVCDKHHAQTKLNEIVVQAQKEREGLVAPAAARNARSRPITEAVDEFAETLHERGRCRKYVEMRQSRLKALCKECDWSQITDMNAASFLKWRRTSTLAPKTKQDYLAAARGFIKWLKRRKYLGFDPLEDVESVETRGKKVRERRAMIQDEVQRLLDNAPDDRRGFYVVAFYTGLRRGELQSLQWGDIALDEEQPYVRARASTTKNKKESIIPLHADAAETLRAKKPDGATGDMLVFGHEAHDHNLRRFKRDLKAAGIEQQDAQGRVVDFHAFARKTPNTLLGRQHVGERIRQEFMRHSDPRLTNADYIDVTALPVMEAVNRLPTFEPAPGGCHKGVSHEIGSEGHGGPCQSVPEKKTES